MSKINITALGGLNEVGKNMYVIEVDGKIYVFDAGLKFNIDNIYGVDYILPDFTYLKNNIDRVEGFFITHPHISNMGALVDILKDEPRFKVYGSNLTIEILKSELESDGLDPKEFNLNKLKAHKMVDIGGNTLFPIQVTHSVPESFLYVLYTPDGSIVYTGDYLFDTALKGKYACDLGKLAYVGKGNVLCLLGESSYAKNEGYTVPRNRSVRYIEEIFSSTKNRIISTIDIDHVYRMQEIMDVAEKEHKKIIIMGKDLQNRINLLMDLGYLSFKGEIGSLRNLEDNNIIILVKDDNINPFFNLDRIAKGFDKYIKLNKEDIVFISEPGKEGLERQKAEIMDLLSPKVSDVITMDGNHLLFHPSKEDVRMMINLIHPKYYFPVRGEYKDQVYNADIAYEEGFSKDDIILKENGQVVTFENGRLLKKNFKTIKVDEILVDGKVGDDVGDLVLKDREALGNSGIVVVTASLSRKTKKLIAGPEIVTKGFVVASNNEEIFERSKEITREILETEITSNNRVDFNEIKNSLRKKLGNYYYEETEIRPLVISVIQEV